MPDEIASRIFLGKGVLMSDRQSLIKIELEDGAWSKLSCQGRPVPLSNTENKEEALLILREPFPNALQSMPSFFASELSENCSSPRLVEYREENNHWLAVIFMPMGARCHVFGPVHIGDDLSEEKMVARCIMQRIVMTTYWWGTGPRWHGLPCMQKGQTLPFGIAMLFDAKNDNDMLPLSAQGGH